MIAAAIERCAGIDVGKKFLAVCLKVGPLEGEPRTETGRSGTTVAELKRLRDWLKQEGITHAVMESTGSYWKPVCNVLEDAVKVYLANPQDVKNRKGHKADSKDSWWLAHLLRHAMIRPTLSRQTWPCSGPTAKRADDPAPRPASGETGRVGV